MSEAQPSGAQSTERAKSSRRAEGNVPAPATLVRFQFGLLVVLGLVLGELAALWAFSSPIDQAIADRDAARPAVVAAQSRLDSAESDRSRLDTDVAVAQKALDAAVVRANCEVNPKPGCPTDGQVTGVAGAGSETEAARTARTAAMANLDDAIAARTQRAPAIDARISKAQDQLASAQAAAPANSSSLGVRWIALNSYSVNHFGALALRMLLIGLLVVVCVAPLLLLRWRSESAAKRLARAEAQAETEIAIRKAELRAEAEKLQAEQELEKAKIAAEAELFLEQEKQRRRVAAELGESPREIERAQNGSGQLALPHSEKAPSWVPAPFQGIASLASSVISAPARVAQTVVEEFEELTFTITRKHRVTVTPQEAPPELIADSALVIDAEIVDELPSAPRRELPRGF